MEQPEEKVRQQRRRGPAQAAWAMAENLVYFLAPMVLADRAAQGLKPLLMEPEDLRGPWECLWHKVSTGPIGRVRPLNLSLCFSPFKCCVSRLSVDKMSRNLVNFYLS